MSGRSHTSQHTPVIPAFRRLKQEDGFKVSYLRKLSLKQTNKKPWWVVEKMHCVSSHSLLGSFYISEANKLEP
jgi:hypothetical protein